VGWKIQTTNKPKIALNLNIAYCAFHGSNNTSRAAATTTMRHLKVAEKSIAKGEAKSLHVNVGAGGVATVSC